MAHFALKPALRAQRTLEYASLTVLGFSTNCTQNKSSSVQWLER